MSKERFTRARIHDTKMKRVIIRVDYSGVSDSAELVKLFDKRFPKWFRERHEHHNREFNIQLRKEDIQTISETLSLPVTVIEHETIMRYRGMKNVNCDVTLYISKYYLCMTLKCENNYDGLDKYIECFKGAITTFKDEIPYFCPRRLGLRKVRVEDKTTFEAFNEVFEEHVYAIPDYGLNASSFLRTEYVDSFELSNPRNLRFNVRGLMERSTKDDSDLFTASLDIDAYYAGDFLAKADINNLINTANIQEFEVYKYCMKEDYLQSIYE